MLEVMKTRSFLCGLCAALALEARTVDGTSSRDGNGIPAGAASLSASAAPQTSEPDPKVFEATLPATITSPIAIGLDGTLFFGGDDGKAYAVSPQGNVLWSVSVAWGLYTAPVVGADGTLYIRAGYWLSAISSEGAVKWQYWTGISDYVAPAIGPDSTIYFGGGDSSLAAVDPDGLLKWKLPIGYALRSSPSVGADGTIYLGSGNGNLYAVGPSGSVSWTCPIGSYLSTSPVIGADGTIYVGSDDKHLYAVKADGQLKWQFLASNYVECEPSIGSDGTIYVGAQGAPAGSGSSGMAFPFYAIHPDGTKRWETVASSLVTAPVITSSGSLYFGGASGLVALAPDSAPRWVFAPGGAGTGIPVFGADGIVYVASGNKLYGLRSSESLGAGSWPMLRRDARHTASLAAELQVGPTILTQPESVAVLEGLDASFEVVATGSSSLSYQWSLNGNDLPGETRPTLDIPQAQAHHSGTYRVRVSQSQASVVSEPATLVVEPRQTYSFSTLAGSSATWGHEDGIGAAASFNFPSGVAADNAGNVYVADQSNHTIRKISSQGIVTTLAGAPGITGDAEGTGSAARFRNPTGVAVNDQGILYVADSGNNRILRVSPGGLVRTLAGSVANVGSADGVGGAAQFHRPIGVAVGVAGDVYVADTLNHTIRKITQEGVVSTLAGWPDQSGSADGVGSAARFCFPKGVAVDQAGNVYVADWGNNVIRRIDATGRVTTFAGQAGTPGTVDHTGPAARFSFPFGVAVDHAGNVYVADADNRTVRRIARSGVVATLGGLAGTSGHTDGTGSNARFAFPFGIAVDSSTNVFVGDAENNAIRKGILALPGNASPVTASQTVATPEDTPIAITLTGQDPENDPLTYVIDGSPAHGALSGIPPNLIYTPAPDYFGPDQFDFTVRDPWRISTLATVWITVESVNDPPVANNQVILVSSGASTAITLTARDVDSRGLHYEVVSPPSHGTLTGSGILRTYTPLAGFIGSDSFSFKAGDGQLDSVPAVVSISVGLQAGEVIWDFSVAGTISGSPALAADGTVIVATGDPAPTGNKLYALRSDGSLKWDYSIDEAFLSSPSVAADGTIIVGGSTRLYAINADGTRKWDFVVDNPVYSAAAIAKDGTIYCGTDSGRLYALRPDGSRKWDLTANDQPLRAPPGIGNDGVVYVSNFDPEASWNHFFFATPQGHWIGTFDRQQPFRSSIAVANYGSVFFGCDDGMLYEYRPPGPFVFPYQAGGPIATSPAIASDGTIYFGSLDGKLYALNPDRSKKWEFAAAGPIRSSPTLDVTGAIYFAIEDGTLYALAPDGSKKWDFAAGGVLTNAPTLGPNGVLYVAVGSPTRKLFALRANGSPMEAPWPMQGHDPQHTGRAAPADEFAPVVLEQPTDRTIEVGTTFSILFLAAGSEPLSYQWMFNSVDLPGATAATLYFHNIASHQAGAYSVRVSNPVGSVISTPAIITVVEPNAPPSISFIPDRTLPEGLSPIIVPFTVQDAETPAADLRVTAVSFNPSLVTSASLVVHGSGANRTLHISPVASQTGAAGIIVTVTDSGASLQSRTFLLTILADADHDTMPDSFEVQQGFDPSVPQDGSQDSDGDGFSNAMEYFAGTDPRDSTSCLTITEIVPGGAETIVSFSTVIGKRYRVEWSQTGPRGPWATVQGDIPGTGATMQVVDSGRAVQSVICYRVLVEL